MPHIIIPYTPRPQQAVLYEDMKRFSVWVMHRRFGKTVLAINILIRKACEIPGGRFAYIADTRDHAKDIAWDYIKEYTRVIPEIEWNETELRCDFPWGSRIRLYGADKNPHRIRGLALWGAVLDEYEQINPIVWSQIVRPALADHQGFAIFMGTPAGMNQFYDLYEGAADKANWTRAMYKASETDILPAEELEAAIEEMGEDMYLQEFECFPSGSLVACHDRVRPIDDIREGDSVLTHTGRFRRVDAVMSREYSGDLVVIEAYGSRPLKCTPEHPIRVCDPFTQLYSWVNAEDLEPGDWLVTPKLEIRTEGLIEEALAKVIAWYVAEGNVSGNRIVFAIGSHEPDYVDDLTEALMACGHEPDFEEKDGVAHVGVNNVVLADFLVAQCGSLSHNKRLPMGLLRGHEAVVWDTLIKGDGCTRQAVGRAREWIYTSVSEGLVQQVQILAGTLGKTGTYSVRENSGLIQGREVNTRTAYTLMVRANGNMQQARRNKTRSAKNGALGKVRAVSREPYEGLVHNLSVFGDESYVVNARAVHNCSWTAAIKGSYYGNEMRQAREDGRIGDVPYDPAYPVDTWWDLGRRHSTVIWCTQTLPGGRVNCIDLIHGSGMELSDYARLLFAKPYVYRAHIGPHDLNTRHFPLDVSAMDVGRNLGIYFTVAEKLSVHQGIDAARRLIKRCWFDQQRCYDGIRALEQYRTEYNPARGNYSMSPREDFSTDFADAFRMGAVTPITSSLSVPWDQPLNDGYYGASDVFEGGSGVY